MSISDYVTSGFDDVISAIESLLTWNIPLTGLQEAALAVYGGYQPQWGDSDTANPPVYEGQGRTPPDQLPAPGDDGYVTILQQNLQRLGIMPSLPVDGVFDRYTSWQLREFQIYAGRDTVATLNTAVAAGSPRADQLTATANDAQYTGDINGRLDGPTALALQAWLANGYVCPVVAESRDQGGTLIVDNVWFGSEDAQNGHRCWVTDLTGTYTVDPARIAAQGAVASSGTHPKVLVGSYATTGYGNGPVCQQGTEWSNNATPQGTDITIATLTGDTVAQADAATISTYKVVRAVAHVESPENFDCINAYDAGTVSVSPYHFTLFSKGAKAEMPAFLSYLDYTLEDAYDAAFFRYGITVADFWPTDGSDPTKNALYVTAERKWATFPQQLGLQTLAGTVSVAPTSVTNGDDCDYFRTWHWIYRWVILPHVSRHLDQMLGPVPVAHPGAARREDRRRRRAARQHHARPGLHLRVRHRSDRPRTRQRPRRGHPRWRRITNHRDRTDHRDERRPWTSEQPAELV
jgi:Putative peptidoglycan binding domain